MNLLIALSQFLASRFPWWGICHLRFEPKSRTLYLLCVNSDHRSTIFRDASNLSRLDIGIERFIVIHPGYPDIIIPYIPRQSVE